MGKKKAATTTTNTQVTPWAPQGDAITDIYRRATTAQDAMPTGPNADQTTAMDWLRAQAPGLSTGSTELRNLGTATARGDFLDPASNPWIASAVEAAQRPLREQLDQNILSIGDAAQRSGAYGGDREQLLRGQALGDFNQSALDIANQIYFQNYQNERNLQQNAGALLSQGNALALAPGQLLGALGDQQYQWATDMPYAGLDRLAQILQLGSSYSNQNTVSTGTPATAGGLQTGLSGALGGASAGAAFGPWGAGIGAAIGGLGGLFGG
jgi:hypothetical protein